MLAKFLEKSMTIVYQGLPDFLRIWLLMSKNPFRGFSTPSFPFRTLPKTKNSEMKAMGFSLWHFDQTPRFSNSEFPILHCTLNQKLKTGVFSKVI